MKPITPHLSIRNPPPQSIKLGSDDCFAIRPDCVVCRKEGDAEVTETNLASVEIFVEFKWSSESDPFHFPNLPKASEKCGKEQSAEASKKPDERLRMPFNQSFRAFVTMGQIGTYVTIQNPHFPRAYSRRLCTAHTLGP